MRNVLLTTSIMACISIPALADVISEVGTPVRATGSEDQHGLIYSFAPINVPGNVTGINFTYVGSVVPGVSASGLSTLASYTITPNAQIQNTDVPVNGGYSNVIVNSNSPTAAGTPITITNGQPTFYPGSSITVSATAPVNAFNIAGLSTGPISLVVAGYTTLSNLVSVPNGSGYVGTPFDLSTVNAGRLTLAVTYDPVTSVPEPLSLALLGTGLVGALFIRRRA